MAKKVTDVRNWFNFQANENYFGDGSLKEFYSDSSGKSGEQKEKLAYTVLASSIAFAYGLEGENDRSFCFVVIDEAFGKGSDDSTRYGLELFKKTQPPTLGHHPDSKDQYYRTVYPVDSLCA